MKKFVGYLVQKALGKDKVSPTIKSVKPNLTKSVKQTKTDEYRKRYTALDKAEGKLKTGKQMMKEGQKDRKKLVDTKRAFQFKGGSYHAVQPGEKPEIKYKGLLKEQKAKGGRVGLKFGSRKSNVQKIQETFAPKKNLSPKQMKIAKLAGDKNKIDAADFKKLRNR